MFDIIRFVFPLAFQRRIQNYSTANTREDITKRKRKVENDVPAFLHYFGFVQIIRFVFPLAFQRCVPNCSTTKTPEAMAKTRHKVENDGKGGGRV